MRASSVHYCVTRRRPIKDSLERFRRLVSSSLTEDSIFEVDELDRPFAVTNLAAQADDVLRSEVTRLSDENSDLRKELEKLRSRKARRRHRTRR
jgi:hypothetical protein